MPRTPINSPAAAATALSRFLSILTQLHAGYPERFSEIGFVRGRTRVYFAQTRQELESSGRSVKPVRIPGTGWWAVSNNDTARKRRMLKKVFAAIRCTKVEEKRWLEQFDSAEQYSVSVWDHTVDEDVDSGSGPKI